jgi:hypothetical protein
MSYVSLVGRASLPLLNLSGSSLSDPSAIEAFLVNNLTRLHARRERHRLDILANYQDDWDGRGSLRPSPATIRIAKLWIAEISRTVSAAKPWMHPHITISEDGEAVFEWWRAEKKITLYVSEQQITFIKVWGDNIETSMEDGNLRQATDFNTVWNWLFS